MRAPDAGRILRFLTAFPLSRRTIPAPAREQRAFDMMVAGWEPGLLGWCKWMRLGKTGGFCSPAIAGMLTDPCPQQPLQAHMEPCTPISPKKMSSPKHFRTTESFLDGPLTSQGYGSRFMPPFVSRLMKRPLGGKKIQRGIFLPLLRLQSI